MGVLCGLPGLDVQFRVSDCNSTQGLAAIQTGTKFGGQCSLSPRRHAHLSELSACPLVVASTHADSDRPLASGSGARTRRRGLLASLASRSVVIVGDSMARQAFMVLVARLRGQAAVVDFNAWSHFDYWLYLAPHSVADILEVPTLGVGLDRRSQINPSSPSWRSALPEWHATRREALAALAIRTRQRTVAHSPSGDASAHVAFRWAPCWEHMRAVPTELHRQQQWSHVIVFSPAYWHLHRMCRTGPNDDGLQATSTSVMDRWVHWLALSRSRNDTRYTVVSPPATHVSPPSQQRKLLVLNAALRERFAARAFPPNWDLVDFAAMMERLRPPTASGVDSKHVFNWHYACHFQWPLQHYAPPRNHSVTVAAKVGTGDCAEEGNTALWDEILGGGGGRGERPRDPG